VRRQRDHVAQQARQEDSDDQRKYITFHFLLLDRLEAFRTHDHHVLLFLSGSCWRDFLAEVKIHIATSSAGLQITRDVDYFFEFGDATTSRLEKLLITTFELSPSEGLLPIPDFGFTI
jgi:hypothetical protein